MELKITPNDTHDVLFVSPNAMKALVTALLPSKISRFFMVILAVVPVRPIQSQLDARHLWILFDSDTSGHDHPLCIYWERQPNVLFLGQKQRFHPTFEGQIGRCSVDWNLVPIHSNASPGSIRHILARANSQTKQSLRTSTVKYFFVKIPFFCTLKNVKKLRWITRYWYIWWMEYGTISSGKDPPNCTAQRTPKNRTQCNERNKKHQNKRKDIVLEIPSKISKIQNRRHRNQCITLCVFIAWHCRRAHF